MKTYLFISLLLALFLVSCQNEQHTATEKAPLFDNLGRHELKITTTSEEAQKFFNQGLNLTYGFNHAEAGRSFGYAATVDTNCGMCYWGLAYVLGPNINLPMDTSVVKSAYEGAQKALAHSSHLTDWEKALIEALAVRYVEDKNAERAPLDSAYAAAMRNVYERFPDHADIAALCAEAMMTMHPWDFYLHDGTPQPWTPEIVQVLEHALSVDSLNPLANHMYIHATEASYTPDRALVVANRLGGMVPGSGHLVHMPSHTYIRTGHYHEGSVANIKAGVADSLYTAACYAQGFYPLAYIPHNHHFLAACAMLEGNSENAMIGANATVKHTLHDMVQDPGLEGLQHFLTIPYCVQVKFERWDDILEQPEPSEGLDYPKAMWHYAKGRAYAGKGLLAEAENELTILKSAAADTNLRKVAIFINTVGQVLDIASIDLEAELARKKGDLEKSITLLTQAVALEDSMAYNEPPDWLFSLKHSLGSVLLEAGKFAEAEQVYLNDLKKLPENGWALNGLHKALIKQNKTQEAVAVKARMDKAWQYADVKLKDSRLEGGGAEM